MVLLAGVAPASSVYTFQLRQLSNATGGTIFPLPPAIFLYQDGVFASTYSEGTCLCALKQTPSPYASIKQQESQRIVLRSDAPMTAGTFTLTFTAYGSPETTAPIPFNATADELEVALRLGGSRGGEVERADRVVLGGLYAREEYEARQGRRD